MNVISRVIDYEARYKLIRVSELSHPRFIDLRKGFCRLSVEKQLSHIVRIERRGPQGTCGIRYDLRKAVPAQNGDLLCKSCARWLQTWYERKLLQLFSDKHYHVASEVYGLL